MEIGKRVRKARKQALLTQGELAALAGVGITTIVRVERGQVDPHPHTVKLLARALGAPPSALVADEEPLTRDAGTFVTRSLSPDS